MLASFPILEYDSAAAEWHAAERARLEKAGETPPFRRRTDRGDRECQLPGAGYRQ